MKGRILVVEDDEVMRHTLADVLKKDGHKVYSAADGEKGLLILKNELVDMVLLDYRLPGLNGLSVLKEINEMGDEPLVIMITAYPEVEKAVAAIKSGAYDYINKPFELDELLLLVDKGLHVQNMKNEIYRLRHLQAREYPEEIVGVSPGIEKVRQLIKKIADSPESSLLIKGESGTGKELVADAVHYASARKDRTMIKINCSGIPDTLLEMELFGYEKGAFTDAKTSKKGLLELADGGTLLLDEIGTMSPLLQPKLLRVLDERCFRRIGGLRSIPVDVRFVAATNEDLASLISRGQFREDLYYRLNVIMIEVPPLRERKEDIMLLASLFLERSKQKAGKEIRGFSEAAEELLKNYLWPGNIRELENVIERAVILCDSSTITSRQLALEGPKSRVRLTKGALTIPSSDDIVSLDELEQNYLMRVLGLLGNNKSETARRLGISRSTLNEKLKRSG